MPQPERKTKLLRILVPIILIAFGLVFAWSVMRNSMPRQPAAPAQGAAPATPATPASGATTAQAPAQTPAQPAAQAEPQTPQVPLTGLRARAVQGSLAPADLATIGGDTPGGTEKMLVRFHPVGAGIDAISLADHFKTVDRKEHEVVQETRYAPKAAGNGPALGVSPMAALAVKLNDELVDLAPPSTRIWRETAPGAFEAVIENAQGHEVARIVRRYEIAPGEYYLRLHQQVINLTGAPLKVTWYQFGPVDLPLGTVGYGGDVRRVRFGYLRSPTIDPSQQHVQAGRFLMPHGEVRGKPLDAAGTQWPQRTLWPNRRTQDDGLSLVWAAMTNRYFAAAVFPLIDPDAARADKRLHLAQTVDRFAVPLSPGSGYRGETDAAVVLRFTSPEITVPPSGSADFSAGIYAGPLSRRMLRETPLTASVGLDELVVYTFGGPCGFCTFQSLTYGLLALMRVWHDYIVFDWALAIIMLVVCVRTVLHPVTKWSQTSMYRFGKQMQALAPKQKKIQEKYKDDPKKLREELARLMREENINYAGALGCLPMFLQTPIWIALFAMLYFAFELRHQAAFFGVFQSLTGGSWHFLADLAEPDNAIPFGRSIWIPLVSSLMGPISGLNILPIILGLVFFIQQKYLTPPTTASLTPEQETQQKVMKVMIVVMFPLFMYNAPSGLALYFLTNSTLGILESRYIRKHAERVDAIKAEQAKHRPPRKGFMQRLQEQIEARQKMLEQSRAGRHGGGPGGGGGRDRGGRPGRGR